MQLSQDINERIEGIVTSKPVVLFMKGTPAQPQCGFSAATIGILDKLVADYRTVNVLEDQEVREGIKSYSNWPTIPQLYIDGEFMGGCDLVREMYNRGELHKALGVEVPDRTPPTITLSDDATALIRQAMTGQDGVAVRLNIDAQWQHDFELARPEGHELKVSVDGIDILMDVDTAQRAKGLSIEVTESMQGRTLSINNPNIPPPVNDMAVQDLHRLLESGEALHLYDVRTPDERAKASIEGSVLLDDGTVQTIQGMSKDTKLVFICHTGVRSGQAAEHFRQQGFTDLHNVSGGIDAWSKEVDPAVPQY